MVTSGFKNTSWMRDEGSALAIGRWKDLRPTMSPWPPARLLITAVRTA